MTAHYVSSELAPDTELFCFAVKHDYTCTIDGDATSTPDSGFSPISRWLAWAVDYDDFVSNPDAVGYIARCQVPRGAIVDKCYIRVDTAFAHATPAASMTVGDGNDPDGFWPAAAGTFASAGLKYDDDAPYNTGDASAGVSGPQYYSSGDTVDVIWPNATAPTAGYLVLFIRTISYNEAANAEWTAWP
jgi:hypothetical protein